MSTQRQNRAASRVVETWPARPLMFGEIEFTESLLVLLMLRRESMSGAEICNDRYAVQTLKQLDARFLALA